MPTYQYACTNTDCGNQFELVQSFTDAAASECPVCGGPVRKVDGSVGIVFKGSGFYRTDSRASSSPKSESSGTDSSSGKSDKQSSGKSDSKQSPDVSGSAAGSSGASGSGANQTSGSTAANGAGRSGTKSKAAAAS
jgi:putative FmdB family regulatory protein